MVWKIAKGVLIVLALVFFLLPIYWIVATSFKQWPDIFAIPPKFVFRGTFVHYLTLFNIRPEEAAKFGQVGKSLFPPRFVNSVIITGVSTVLSVALGTFAAYAFSRFRVRGENDLLFFILSTRMLPPIVVGIPFFVVYRALGLIDTHIGLILLYMTFNLSFAVWLMKGFIDEIPKEFEEAALVDGYTRLEAFFKVVLPQTFSGVAATAVFALSPLGTSSSSPSFSPRRRPVRLRLRLLPFRGHRASTGGRLRQGLPFSSCQLLCSPSLSGSTWLGA